MREKGIKALCWDYYFRAFIKRNFKKIVTSPNTQTGYQLSRSGFIFYAWRSRRSDHTGKFRDCNRAVQLTQEHDAKRNCKTWLRNRLHRFAQPYIRVSCVISSSRLQYVGIWLFARFVSVKINAAPLGFSDSRSSEWYDTSGSATAATIIEKSLLASISSRVKRSK